MEDDSAHRSAGIWSGALAALIATVVGYTAYHTAGWFFWPDLFAQWVFAIVPGPVQAKLIGTLGFDAKVLGFYAAILAQIIAGGLIGVTLRRAGSWALGGIVAATLALTSAGFVLSVSAVQLMDVTNVLAGGLTTALLFGLLTPSIRRWLSTGSTRASAKARSASPEGSAHAQTALTRRRMLARVGTLAGAAAMWPWVRANLRPSSAGSDPSTASSGGATEAAEVATSGDIDFDAVPDLSAWLTPQEDFYYVSKNIQVYRTGVETWEPLKVEGLVDSPLELSLDDIKQLPQFDQHVTLVCIDYKATKPATRDLMSNARWTGVSFKTLLEQAGVQDGAKDLELHAADGYSDSLPVDLIMNNEEIMLAWAMNGIELTPKHGYPLRVVIPGYYGVKNVKHLDRIVATEKDYQGYWQNRGWSDECDIHPFAKIETPDLDARVQAGEPQYIAGVAFAGVHGVSAVEVSTDNGKTWREAQVEARDDAPYSWRRWAVVWKPSQTGAYTLRARVIDGEGRTQTADSSASYPDGSTGYDRVRVNATSA